jgi:hypothetical protein
MVSEKIELFRCAESKKWNRLRERVWEAHYYHCEMRRRGDAYSRALRDFTVEVEGMQKDIWLRYQHLVGIGGIIYRAEVAVMVARDHAKGYLMQIGLNWLKGFGIATDLPEE